MKIKKFMESIIVSMFVLGLLFSIFQVIHWNNYFKASPVRITELSEEELKIISNEFGIELNSNDDFEELIAGREKYELKLGEIKDIDELISRLTIDKQKANKVQADILDLKNNAYTDEKYINSKVFTTLKIYKENNQTLGEITKIKLENSKEFYEIVNKRK